MAISIKKIDKAYNILKEYNGKNPYITFLKISVSSGTMQMNDFLYEYVLNNHDVIPEFINKTIKISDWFGLKLVEKFNLDFTPTKIKVGYVIGQMGDSLHCYVKFRKSQTQASLIYLPKKAMLDDVYEEDYENIEIDFEYYDKIGAVKNIVLKPHQKIGVKFLLGKKKAILADSMGTGKTIELIIASLAGKFKKILVICPASLKTNWKKEIGFYVDEKEITIVNGQKWNESKYVILNYEILKNFYEVPMEWDEEREKMVKTRKKELIQNAIENSQLFQSKFDLVIIDECHKLSNSTSTRYKIIDDFLKRSNPDSIYLSTGTPITNNTANLYNILRLINADIIKDYQYYMTRYCGAFKIFNKKLNRDILIPKGSTNLEELKEKIKHLYIRRTAQDIGNIVDKNRKVIYYDLTNKQQSDYDKLWNDYQQFQFYEGNDVSKYQALIEGTILRQWAATEMINNSIDIAESHIEDGEKVIIMCCYDEEIDLLQKHFKDKCVVYNGKMTIKQKDKAKEEFIENPKKKVFIGNIISAGVGLTLIVSNVCIFNSFDWVSGNNAQAEDRIVRIGQTKDCTIYYQVFNDTIFEKMFTVVNDKQEIIDTVIKKEDDKIN